MSEGIQPRALEGDGEFVSFCPPDIQPRTRIIALCGVNDWHDNASPQEDGWFLSDFYLFYHLLEDTDGFRFSNQLWLTCVDPRTLVSKYGEYVHGGMNGDRRAVLDAKILERVESSKNIRVIPPEDPLERFLAVLKSEMQIAAKENQPILVLIFGHGDEGTYGVAIGGEGSSLGAPRLTRRKFNAAIHPGVDLNLLITSCYSGGWLVKPMVGSFLLSMSKLNISGMAAVDEEEMSRSWAQSVFCGRAGGSIYASAVFHALVKNSESSRRDCSDSVTVATLDEELTASPNYINLCNSIYEAYKNMTLFIKNTISHFQHKMTSGTVSGGREPASHSWTTRGNGSNCVKSRPVQQPSQLLMQMQLLGFLKTLGKAVITLSEKRTRHT